MRSIEVTKILIIASALCLPWAAGAQVVINEIMYDLPGTDTGREWLEVHNTGGVDIDLTTWKLLEANVNHGINEFQGGVIIPAGGYAVVADNATKFLEDWPGWNGVLFDSAFSLANTGEALVLKNSEGVIVDDVAYSADWGALGDGNSLQRVSGTWVAAAPTPGATNTSEPVPTSGGNEESGASPSGSSIASVSSVSTARTPAVRARVDIPRLASVQAPVDFSVVPDARDNKSTRYYWSFGDGAISRGLRATHWYEFPGVYTVVLTIRSGDDVSVMRSPIEIIEPQLTVSAVLSGLRGYIELENPSAKEINLEGWQIAAGGERFLFSGPTYLNSKQKLKLPNKISQLDPTPDRVVTVSFPSNAVAAVHSVPNPERLAYAVDSLKAVALPPRQAISPAPSPARVVPPVVVSPVPVDRIVPPATDAASGKTVILGEKAPESKWWQRLFSR